MHKKGLSVCLSYRKKITLEPNLQALKKIYRKRAFVWKKKKKNKPMEEWGKEKGKVGVWGRL